MAATKMSGGFTRVRHVGTGELDALKQQMIALRPFEITFDGPIGMRVLDEGDIGSVVPNSAAAQHGITASHEIVAINGHKVKGMSEAQVVEMLVTKPVKVLFRLAPAAPVLGSSKTVLDSVVGCSPSSPALAGSSQSSHTSSVFTRSSRMSRMFHRSSKAGVPGKDLIAFEVTCPDDHSAGDVFRMRAPNSRMYEVKVPKKIKPGDKFVVHVDATVTCDGYLDKLSNSRFKGFQKRWFQIHQGVLEYYEHQNEAKAQLEGLPTVSPIKALALTELVQVLDHFGASKANVSTDPHMEFQVTFALSGGDRTLYLRAASEQEKRAWVAALKGALSSVGRRVTGDKVEKAGTASASLDAESIRARSVAANHRRALQHSADAQKLQHQRERESEWQVGMAVLTACVGTDDPPPPVLTAEQIESIRSGDDGEKRVAKLVSQRNHMIYELVTTERTYGENIRLTLVEYYAPMIRGDVRHLLTASISRTIFSNVEQLAKTQIMLQAKLDATWEAAQTAKKSVSDSEVCAFSVLPFLHAWRQVLPSLHAYEKYVCNFELAIRQLDELEAHADGWWSKDPLQMWLRNTSQRTGRPLRALLILPVQRLPRYNLLFKTILKVSTLQVERDALQAVIDLIETISQSIEESSRDKAHMDEMASTYRRLVRGTKSEADRQNFEDLMQMLLLFSDTIFIAERVMEKGVEEGKEDLQYVDKIDLEEMLIERDPEQSSQLVIGGEEGVGGVHSWRVTLSDKQEEEGKLSDVEKWEQSFHEVGAVFIGPDGKDEEEAEALRIAKRATLPAASDLLSGRQRLRSVIPSD